MSTHADCRMYESKYPDVDDVVMVQVKSIAEMGAYVSLLEYNGIEGMILLSELVKEADTIHHKAHQGLQPLFEVSNSTSKVIQLLSSRHYRN